MSRILRLYLNDIVESCKKIAHYTSGMSFVDLSSDEKTLDAVVRNHEIIGEAVKSLPPDLLDTHSEVEWRKIARFRDVVTHHYFKVDIAVIWDIIENKIEPLRKAVEAINNELGADK